MEFFISVGMLVCVLAWVVRSYHRVLQLRRAVQASWSQWVSATQHRNDCLNDFTEVLERLHPPREVELRTLQRLLADSRLSLKLTPQPIWGSGTNYLPQAEWALRMQLDESVRRTEESERLNSHERLQQLCGHLRSSLYQQEQCAQSFNRCAGQYNRVLGEPLQRMLAPVFGFSSAATLRQKR